MEKKDLVSGGKGFRVLDVINGSVPLAEGVRFRPRALNRQCRYKVIAKMIK